MDKNEENLEQSDESKEEIPAPPKLQPKVQLTAERLQAIRKQVEEAKEQKKTFTVKGCFPVIRSALLERGWLERIEDPPPLLKIPNNSPLSVAEDICINLPIRREWENANMYARKCDRMVASRLLQTHDVDFYWSVRRDCTDWHERINKNKTVNRFARLPFTSKEGLCRLLQNMHWFNEPGVSEVRFPRCYAINYGDQYASFVEDFRISACVSLLRWYVGEITRVNLFHMTSPTGRVPSSTVRFAVDRCNEFTAGKKHIDLDSEFSKTWECEWDMFLSHFQMLVLKGEKFDPTLCTASYAQLYTVNTALNNIKPYMPQYQLDGMRNLWILKPANKCRGKDIQIIKDIEEVTKVLKSKLKYVVQKYIERPLLIYNTKFDIRQWFLVTGTFPLSIWMYRECYLRFSSKPFTLNNLHESVHLTNHAVQHKYRTEKCHDALPDDKMWDSQTFKRYLREIGQAEQWYTKIYPGMRECIVGTMLASQDFMERRANTFELFGADFMIATDFSPWLIEINSCPAMGSTTSVTSKMCPQCYEDIIKVVIDRRTNPKAETGLFDEIFRQEKPKTPPYVGTTLTVKGEKMRTKKLQSAPVTQKTEQPNSGVRLPKHKIPEHVPVGSTIKNVLEKIGTDIKACKEKTNEKIKKATQRTTLLSKSTPASMSSNVAAKRHKCIGVSDIQKAKAPTACRTSINRAISVDRKANQRKTTGTRPRASDRWKLGKPAPLSTTWEQDTASILKFRSELITGTKPFQPNAATTVTNILPGIDLKTAITPPQVGQNLFTIGLAYKPVVKENIESAIAQSISGSLYFNP